MNEEFRWIFCYELLVWVEICSCIFGLGLICSIIWLGLVGWWLGRKVNVGIWCRNSCILVIFVGSFFLVCMKIGILV